jgi:hypothetical protein
LSAGFPKTLAAIVAIAALIGWIAPFDVYYTAVTGGSPVARTLVIALVAVAGGLASRSAGLSLGGQGRGAPLGIGLSAAALVAARVVLLDCVLFRASLPDGFAAFLRAPLHVRLFYFMLRAFNENVIYRLFGFGGSVWLLGKWRGRAPGMVAMLAVAAAVQAVNIGGNVIWAGGAPITAAGLGYDALRFILPGMVSAWLFTRYGFATAEVASVSCHLFLQPAYSLLLN